MNDFSNISAESDLKDLMTVSLEELGNEIANDLPEMPEEQCMNDIHPFQADAARHLIKEILEEKPVGEYYADLDAASGLWCVFHTDAAYGKAFASYSNVEEADADAARRNGKV